MKRLLVRHLYQFSQFASFKNRAVVDVAIELDPSYQDPGRDDQARIRAQFREKYASERNSHEPLILPPGAKARAHRHENIETAVYVIEGRAAMTLFELNWSALNARAKAEKSALSVPGVEAFEEGSVRAKASRG